MVAEKQVKGNSPLMLYNKSGIIATYGANFMYVLRVCTRSTCIKFAKRHRRWEV